MKKILIILSAVLMVSSCGKWLDQYPHSAINPENVTEKDVPAMRVGMYSSVQNDPGVYSYVINDALGGDLTQVNLNPIDVVNSTLTPLNSVITGQWNGYFASLYQINNMIEAAERFPQAKDSRLALGEAHYFRAYTYLCLVTRWGGVPILEQNTSAKVKRNTEEEVWEFIDRELDAAIEILGSSKNYYYVSKDAAKALKARVLLYEGRNSEAAALAEELINSKRYALDDFKTIFNIDRPTNRETIFALMMLNSNESNIKIGNVYYTYGHPNKGTGLYRLTDEAATMFENTDKRKSSSVISIEGTYCVNKYPSGQKSSDPFIVSRLGELYLISAEAQGYPAGIARLNELRTKRGVSPLSISDSEDFIDAIIKERRLELMGENHLYYDYVRLNRAVSDLGMREYQQLFPIPGKELQLNELLVPNPGY